MELFDKYVEVDWISNSKEEIKPIKLRFLERVEGVFKYNNYSITSIVKIETDIPNFTITYYCKTQIEDLDEFYILKLNVKKFKWTLYK